MSSYRLADRYTVERGTVLLTGIQALARLPIEQLRADRRRGHRTAAFVSGYPGSPLGGYDSAVGGAAALVPDLPIVCRPGLNEEYAATAVMGSQLAMSRPDHRYDGVVGVWYGKAPGVDRAADALRHASYAGTAPLGGVVALVGDDPAAKSSTLPSSSAGVLADIHLPLLYPADPAQALDLGRHAVELSRSTGLWTALKIVADVADGTATITVDPDRVAPIAVGDADARAQRRPDGMLLTPHTLDIEREIYDIRYALAVEYAAVNRLNATTVSSPDAWIGIIASGITYLEVREAFTRLGLTTDDAIAGAGIRLYRMQMPIPFDPAGVRAFAHGLEELFVIEEKQPSIETLVKDALYALAERPRVVGKRDEHDRPLVPGYGSLDADGIIPALRTRLGERLGSRLTPVPPRPRERITLAVERAPFYCSGCPHNRSTEVPDGTLVGAGIGCHTMAMLMDPERVGDIAGITPMGNEGTQWIGMAPFVETDHLIQNLGDGTYFHSGQLAVTAAVAAGVNVTYKLLYNGAVAMTGGQHAEGQLPVANVVANLVSQGVARVIVTTDEVERYDDVSLPGGVEVWDRSRLLEAQQVLAAVPGVTVLVHDQACAAESRRARKRGKVATPTIRVAINHRVCEGCGDCGRVSNCLSVQPIDTPFGRKTAIDQTTCNLDYSCLEGDCPSFITVDASRRGRRRRHSGRPTDAPPRWSDPGTPIPAPVPVVAADAVNVRITGVGGTGVVTVSQVLATAAMLDGYDARGLDQIGLSQKAGPVVSDLRLRRDGPAFTSRLGNEQADVLLGFDLLVAASEKGLRTLRRDHTVVVGSSSVTPTGAMITHPEIAAPSVAELAARISELTGSAPTLFDADAIATAALGDAQTANVVVIGAAVQRGALPIDPDHIETALQLNGVAVEANITAFRLGRRLVAEPSLAAILTAGAAGTIAAPAVALSADMRRRIDELTLDPDAAQELERLTGDLIDYQSEAYARRHLDDVAAVAEAERRVAGAAGRLTRAVAVNLHRLMAYKDEYEVARLLRLPDGRAEADRLADASGGRLTYRLHPPLLAALGLDRKIEVSERFDPMFRLLAAGKRLRGTAADPFGRSEVRRTERAIIEEYRVAVSRVLPRLDATNLDAVVELASLPDLVRGYESLKMTRVVEFRTRLTTALAAIELATARG